VINRFKERSDYEGKAQKRYKIRLKKTKNVTWIRGHCVPNFEEKAESDTLVNPALLADIVLKGTKSVCKQIGACCICSLIFKKGTKNGFANK